MPQDIHDSVLLPKATDEFHRQENIENFAHWMGNNGALNLVLALVVTVLVISILIVREGTNR